MTDDGVSSADGISRPEEEVIAQYIENREGLIHIFGEPGVGKTTVLDHIEEEFEDDFEVDRRNIRANHNLDEIFRKIYHAIFDGLPDAKKEEGRKFAGLSLNTPVGGGGLSFETQEAEASRAQFEYRDAMLGLSELFPDRQTLIICVDDVHELSGNERKIQGAIQEAAEILPINVILITAGRLSWGEIDTSVSLSMFTEEQTVTYLQNVFPEITTEEARTVHEQLGGHPLYIGLLAEANADGNLPDIPEEEIQQEIKKRYFEFLDPDERRLLLVTAQLEELNEELSTRVASRIYDFDRVTVGSILDSLNTRTIVQTLGINAGGLQTFKVHDVFRDFLKTRSDHAETARAEACVYHAEKLIQLVGEDRAFETEIDHATSWASHLSGTIIHEEQDVLTDLIETTIADDGLRFYPSSLLVDEFKKRDAAVLPDTVVRSLLPSVNASCNMANHFYDADLDPSWAELIFQQGAFTDPNNNLLSYLGRTAEIRPSFVRRVGEEIEPDDLRTLRFLISVGRDLPVDDAAVIGQRAARWVREDEAYGHLASYVLRLASYLVEHDEYDVPLEVLDAILTPRDEKQLDVDQGMVRYNLTTVLDDHFDKLLHERGEQLLSVFASNLSVALQQRSDEDEDYGTVADGTSFADLRFVEEDRGTLGEVLLDYFVRVITEWVGANPTGDQECEFVEWLLTEPTVFRRTGLYVLSEFPEAFEELVEEEVTSKENYREQQSQYEFYLVLGAGFEHFDDAAQQRVCELIEDGPYTNEVEDRAAKLAKQGEESASYFEQRIRETWQRNRLYLIREHLEDPYAAQLDELLEKYGEPDRFPSQIPGPKLRGGVVHERGPVETEELREQPAEDVLMTAVEWEPPESERWDTGDNQQFEEQNYVGFSRQLGELIKEDPQRYAREISVLEDAYTPVR